MWLTTVVGFGITDLQLDEHGVLVDDRVCREGYLHCPFDYSYSDYVNSTSPYVCALLGHCRDYLLSDFIFCRNNILCIVPPEHPELANGGISDEQPVDRVELLSRIPGASNLIDIDTGRSIPHTYYHLFQQKYAELDSPSLGGAERMNIEYALLDLAEMMGFRTMEDLVRNVRTATCTSVFELCEYTKMFKSRDIALSLRPMRYSYWK